MSEKKEADIVPIETVEYRSEWPTVDFNTYETICNHDNDSSRRRGILSEDSYKDIILDPNTGFINIGNTLIPALIDMRHGLAMGYDTDRCKRLASELTSNVKILSFPVNELDDDEKTQLVELFKPNNECALFFSDHNSDESSVIGDILDKAGIGHLEKSLVDPRAAKGDSQAALFLYSCCAEQGLERGERSKLTLRDVQDYYDNKLEPSYTPDGKAVTTLNMGDRISDQEAEEMWGIYDTMFNFLSGEDHPISMQDSKEDFFKLLRTENTMIAATYKRLENGNNELTCFTYFIDNIDILHWLNQAFINKNSHNNPDYVTDIFTPGLVSNGSDRSYAPLSIGFFAKVADEAGLSTNVTYENTNLSKRYVPRIVDHAMKAACKYTTVKPSEVIDEVSYRLWSIGGEDV